MVEGAPLARFSVARQGGLAGFRVGKIAPSGIKSLATRLSSESSILHSITLKEKMQWPWVLILCLLCRIVNCLSSSGNRLLVIVEEVAEKSKYSKFWADLEGRLPVMIKLGIGEFY